MIRILHRSQDDNLRSDLSPADIPAALADAHGLIWVDFQDEPPEVCEPLLQDMFGFHPLAIDDALQETHTPKVDDWTDYLYLVLHAVHFNEKREESVETLEVDVFLGANYLVTYREGTISALERVRDACLRDERHLAKGSGYLLYKVSDEMVTDYLPVVEEIDDAIDRIEDEIFDEPTPRTLEHIFTMKRSLLRLRRIIAPQREVINKIARGDFAVIEPGDKIYFRDIYDHLVRMQDITESLRDLVSSALDAYLSVINNRMNEVMKTLTLITTLFMPVSFLAGFFGMNYFQPVIRLDMWTGRPSFALVLALMALFPLGLYLWMRRRAWM